MNVKEKIPGGLMPPALIASGLILLALLTDQPYSYYRFMKVVVFAAAALIAVCAYQSKRDPVWVWVLGLAAALYNPLFPIGLDPDTWRIVDILTLIALPIGALKVGGPLKP